MEELLQQSKDNMAKAVVVTRDDISSIRSGRATPALVENIKVSAYEGTQILKLLEMATITTMGAKSLVISPYDPSVVKDIEKAIIEANIGLTPSVDGEVIRISLPPLSEEQRQEYIKLVRTKLEAGRVMVRQVRQEAMNTIRKQALDKSITEDDQRYWEKKVQEATDEAVASIDTLGKKKEEELLQV